MTKNFLLKATIITLLVVFLLPINMAEAKTKVKYIHTFQNVAIYYSKGYLIDEDGEKFIIDFDCPNNTVILVTYDNKNTVTRLDDMPINFKILKNPNKK